VQGPEKYLNELGISLPGAVDPSKPAILDVAHRELVNYEAYYFSDDEAMKLFETEPYRYTGKVTDPVSLERFLPTEASPVRSYGGRLFYFASQANASTFDADSVRYGIPMPGMRPKQGDPW